MRVAVPITAALLLTGCNPGASVANEGVSQPNEMVVEGILQNEQSAVAGTIENEADADATPEDGDLTRYSCENGTTVLVLYGEDDGTARLTVAGKTMALLSVTAASGAKYSTDDGITAGQSLTWWTKGDSAMLIQTPLRAAPESKESTTNCRVAGG